MNRSAVDGQVRLLERIAEALDLPVAELLLESDGRTCALSDREAEKELLANFARIRNASSRWHLLLLSRWLVSEEDEHQN